MTEKEKWEETDPGPLLWRGTSNQRFVPAPKPPKEEIVHVTPAAPLAPLLDKLPATVVSTVSDASDEVTRARGFVIRTAPLAIGFAASIAAIVLLGGGAWWAVPVAFAVFALVWGVAFLIHLQRSPAGVAWFQSRRILRMLEKEQDYLQRVDWYERTRKDKDRR